MRNTFDFQDELFDLFRASTTLVSLLNIVDASDIEKCDSKIKRICQDPTLVEPDGLPMFDYSYIPTSAHTDNFLINKPELEFNIYGTNRYVIKLIYMEINRILKSNYEFMQVSSEGQVNSPIQNVQIYRIRYKPLVSS
jgi:hypothetical protein